MGGGGGAGTGRLLLRTVNLCKCISQKEASLSACGTSCAFTGPCWGLSVQKANCLLCQNTSGGLASFYAEHFSWDSLAIPKDRNVIRWAGFPGSWGAIQGLTVTVIPLMIISWELEGGGGGVGREREIILKVWWEVQNKEVLFCSGWSSECRKSQLPAIKWDSYIKVEGFEARWRTRKTTDWGQQMPVQGGTTSSSLPMADLIHCDILCPWDLVHYAIPLLAHGWNLEVTTCQVIPSFFQLRNWIPEKFTDS